MATRRGLRVLDAAQMVVDDVNRLLKNPRLANGEQLRDAAESIPANIQEGFGRDRGPDRNRFLRFARGSAEETNERLRARFAAEEISANIYWPLHHRLVAIVRMLTNLIAAGVAS
jgi:four helix bundle protein